MATLQPQTLRFRPRYSGEILTCKQAFLLFRVRKERVLSRREKKDASWQVTEIWKGRFHSENTLNVFRPHFAEEIWKRSDHRSFCICVWTKPASFWKSSILKMFPVYIKTQRGRFQIPRVWGMFSFEERPFSWQIIVDRRPNRKNKAAFSNFSCVVWTRPQYSLLSSITNQTWRSKLLKLRTGPQKSTEYQIRSNLQWYHKLFLRTDWLVVSTGMLAASYQEFPLTNRRKTSDPGEIRFEVRKYCTSGWIVPSS